MLVQVKQDCVIYSRAGGFRNRSSIIRYTGKPRGCSKYLYRCDTLQDILGTTTYDRVGHGWLAWRFFEDLDIAYKDLEGFVSELVAFDAGIREIGEALERCQFSTP